MQTTKWANHEICTDLLTRFREAIPFIQKAVRLINVNYKLKTVDWEKIIQIRDCRPGFRFRFPFRSVYGTFLENTPYCLTLIRHTFILIDFLVVGFGIYFLLVYNVFVLLSSTQ